jgi:hypothetical protein
MRNDYQCFNKQIQEVIPIFMKRRNESWNFIPVSESQRKLIHDCFYELFKADRFIEDNLIDYSEHYDIFTLFQI